MAVSFRVSAVVLCQYMRVMSTYHKSAISLRRWKYQNPLCFFFFFSTWVVSITKVEFNLLAGTLSLSILSKMRSGGLQNTPIVFFNLKREKNQLVVT